MLNYSVVKYLPTEMLFSVNFSVITKSHSKGQNIFDIKEFDYKCFREAFKKVFEVEGYIDHYKK